MENKRSGRAKTSRQHLFGSVRFLKEGCAQHVLDHDSLIRISLLVEIFKALQILHGRDLADS